MYMCFSSISLFEMREYPVKISTAKRKTVILPSLTLVSVFFRCIVLYQIHTGIFRCGTIATQYFIGQKKLIVPYVLYVLRSKHFIPYCLGELILTVTYWEVLNYEIPFNIKHLILRWVGRHVVTMGRQTQTCDSVICICAGLAAALEAACPMSSSQSHLPIPNNLTLTWITISRIMTTEQKYS